MRNGNYHQTKLQYTHREVLILPMRNGNNANFTSVLPRFSSYPTYEEWKLVDRAKMKEAGVVLILPMRNGNSISSLPSTSIKSRSYPTYEEWKPHSGIFSPNHFTSSYPTYEEWKRLQKAYNV